MNAVFNLGKYLFAIPFLIFGALHFMMASKMAAMAPFGGEIMVYIVGIALIAASISILIGKMDKLACLLLAILLMIFVLTIHLPGIMGAVSEEAQGMAMSGMLKDLGLAGGALMAGKLAKDNAVIG